MASKREQIIDAIVAALAGTVGVSTRIFRSRAAAVARGETPCLVVRPLSETPGDNVVNQREARLLVAIEVYVRSDAAPDSAADDTEVSLHSKLMTDAGITALVIDRSAVQTIFEQDDADESALIVQMQYEFWYRHTREALDA